MLKRTLYKGISFEELSKLPLQKQLPYYTARVRRTILRGESPSISTIRSHIQEKPKYKLRCRSLIILPQMVGKILNVYNGKVFSELRVTEEMCGRYVGEFVATRKPVKHGKAGIGASKSTKYVPLK